MRCSTVLSCTVCCCIFTAFLDDCCRYARFLEQARRAVVEAEAQAVQLARDDLTPKFDKFMDIILNNQTRDTAERARVAETVQANNDTLRYMFRLFEKGSATDAEDTCSGAMELPELTLNGAGSGTGAGAASGAGDNASFDYPTTTTSSLPVPPPPTAAVPQINFAESVPTNGGGGGQQRQPSVAIPTLETFSSLVAMTERYHQKTTAPSFNDLENLPVYKNWRKRCPEVVPRMSRWNKVEKMLKLLAADGSFATTRTQAAQLLDIEKKNGFFNGKGTGMNAFVEWLWNPKRLFYRPVDQPTAARITDRIPALMAKCKATKADEVTKRKAATQETREAKRLKKAVAGQ